jgi:hypothetical protein
MTPVKYLLILLSILCERLVDSFTPDEIGILKDFFFASEARTEARINASEARTEARINASEARTEARINVLGARINILGEKIMRGQNHASEVHHLLSSSIAPFKLDNVQLYGKEGYFGSESPDRYQQGPPTTEYVTATSIYYEPKNSNRSGVVGVMMASHLKNHLGCSPHRLLFACDAIDVAFYLGECSPIIFGEDINISNFRNPIIGEAVVCSGVIHSGDNEYVQRTSIGHTRGTLGSARALKNPPWTGKPITLKDNILTTEVQDIGMSGCTCFANDSFVGSVSSRIDGYGILQDSTAIIECLERLLQIHPAKTALECDRESLIRNYRLTTEGDAGESIEEQKTLTKESVRTFESIPHF